MHDSNNQAICITAYTNPNMLDELLLSIHKEFQCIVHIDKKAETLFNQVRNKYKDVQFVSKYEVNWGGV